MRQSKFYTNTPKSPWPTARDGYEMGKVWGITPHEAYSRMEREGWYFAGYNECGEEIYVSPEDENKDK
jgi:hypothetical protein